MPEVDEKTDELIDDIVRKLEYISEDSGTPKNIRDIAIESKNTILAADVGDEENSPAVCASSCVSQLEDITQDLNCPLHTRTAIYQILSLLEQIRD